MDVVEVERLGEDLAGFTTDVFASLTRAGWRDRAGWYVKGLMVDGRRKSIQPMAGPVEQWARAGIEPFRDQQSVAGRTGPGPDRRVGRRGGRPAGVGDR